jgi:hypothetical protein
LYICFSLSYILTGSVCRPEYSSFSAPLSQCRKHVIFYQIDSILLRKGENNYITSSGTRTRHGKTGRDRIGFVSGSYRVRIGFLVSGFSYRVSRIGFNIRFRQKQTFVLSRKTPPVSGGSEKGRSDPHLCRLKPSLLIKIPY